jgi:hypothetical protein
VHFNLSDFRRFAPSAIAAGWMPAPSPPTIALDLDDHHFPEGSGFQSTDDLIGLYQEHGFVAFTVGAGDWRFELGCRSLDVDYIDVYPIPMPDPGEFLFGFHLVAETLMVIWAPNLAEDPNIFYTYPCTAVRYVHLFGPNAPDSVLIIRLWVLHFPIPQTSFRK